MFTRALRVTTAIPTAGSNIIMFLLLLVLSVTAQPGDTPHDASVTACERCHVPENWTTIIFDHAKTRFALMGAHRSLTCGQCHSLKNFTQAGPLCQDCHTDVHQSRFSQDCQRCHTPENWLVLDMSVAHRNTIFMRGGRHEQLDCLSCHREGFTQGFQQVSFQCQQCHLPDYQNAQNPPHAESSFPTQCDMCHQFVGWQPAYFREHAAYFPIYSGSHQGTWASCTTCHPQAGQYTVFTCLSCHEHEKTKTDSKHDEVRGYVYESSACYQCHPTGQGEGEGD